MIIIPSILLLILLRQTYYISIDSYWKAKAEATEHWGEDDRDIYYFQFFLEFWIAFFPPFVKVLATLLFIGIIIGGIIYWIFFS